MAHPRSRGENVPMPLALQWQAGSSPLARGKHGNRPDAGRALRLIPARAGKTRKHTTEGSRSSAHPRSRGENDEGVYIVYSDGGSSPLARGKHSRISERICLRTGSSPLARGKRQPHNSSASGVRLIPARAGKTPSRSRTWPNTHGSSPLARGKRRRPLRARHARLAHPRSRGENALGGAPGFGAGGSSPLARGKRPT